MQPDRDAASILDMMVAGRRIQEFTTGQDYTEFSKDLKTQSAVIHQIQILGEAAKRISRDLQARYAQIPWSDIIRMRDKLIHHYEVIDTMEVWKVAARDVPELMVLLKPLASQK
jgi:uncharacterized protein with HEPN domain